MPKENSDLDQIVKKRHFTTREILKRDFGEFPPKPLKPKVFHDEAVRVLSDKNLINVLIKIKFVIKNIRWLYKIVSKEPETKKEIKELKEWFANLMKDLKKPYKQYKKNPSLKNTISASIIYFSLIIFSPIIFAPIIFTFTFSLVLMCLIKIGLLIVRGSITGRSDRFGSVHINKTKENNIFLAKKLIISEKKNAYTTLSHENIHILQLCQNKKRLINEVLIEPSDDIYDEYKNKKDYSMFKYFNKPVEIEAYLHELNVNLYQITHKLPTSKLAIVRIFVLTSTKYMHISDITFSKLLDLIFDSTSIEDSQLAEKINSNKKNLEDVVFKLTIPLRFFSQESRRIQYIIKDIPERYAMLIELYGDKELADKIRAEPDIEYSEERGFYFSDEFEEKELACA